MPLGLVAQSVEQRIENPCVGGSIPPRATKNIVHATPTHASGRCRFRLTPALGACSPIAPLNLSSALHQAEDPERSLAPRGPQRCRYRCIQERATPRGFAMDLPRQRLDQAAQPTRAVGVFVSLDRVLHDAPYPGFPTWRIGSNVKTVPIPMTLTMQVSPAILAALRLLSCTMHALHRS